MFSDSRDLIELFEQVQLQAILEDGKTFPDCIPKYNLQEIKNKYTQQKNSSKFNLKEFVLDNFFLPQAPENSFHTDALKPIQNHIHQLWDVLIRKPDEVTSSLIPLPFEYIVPGGRFREIYYWDSYFTMLGLQVSGKINLIESMIKNFSYLIDKVGYIPNGNRSYYLGRSQPPFYALMVQLLANEKGENIFIQYLPQMLNEWKFWTKGESLIDENNTAKYHSVKMNNGIFLNRYWDENDTPRPESFKEDVELTNHSSISKKDMFRHIRAAAESGWDFSCRWFKTHTDFATIHTTAIIPVDLNCLLFNLESTIAKAFEISGDFSQQQYFETRAINRKAAIQEYCWNEKKDLYYDYDFENHELKNVVTLAASFPLFFKIATEKQAKQVVQNLMNQLLRQGGMVTTAVNSGQQWDSPNGWAPLQWITIIGFENYGYSEEATEIAKRWIMLNKDVFKRTGKLMEKYNVVDTHLEAGGGEYPGQDGFGWTNGVLLKLIELYDKQYV